MYGGGELVTEPKRRNELMMSLVNDPSRLRARAQAGPAWLREATERCDFGRHIS
jgi:hypothetical protein